MGGTHALHGYFGVLIHSYPYGVVGLCEPDEADRENLPALVLRAFREVRLPEPVLSIQPPEGKTLVGLETIFSTQAEEFTRQLRLLGQRIELRIAPESFAWSHGDGSTQRTDWAGKAWDRDEPDIAGYITHIYEHTGQQRPSVAVTWAAEYRVNGGGWLEVGGTVTRQSPRAALEVVEAEPVLNGY